MQQSSLFSQPQFERVGVVGSRTFANAGFVFSLIDVLRITTNHIVSGGADGVDSWATEHAERLDMVPIEFKPSYKVPSPERYYQRNQLIVDEVAKHGGVIFALSHNPVTSGTQDTITRGTEAKLPVIVMYPTDYKDTLTVNITGLYNTRGLEEWFNPLVSEIAKVYPQYQERGP